MTKSLRSRQLISGFGVIMVGIVMLGSLLLWRTYHYKIDQKEDEIKGISFNVLGFLEFRENKFMVVDDPRMQAKAQDVIEEHKLNDTARERFAYVIDVHTQQIIWSSQNSAEPGPQVDPDRYLYFDVDSQTLGFEPRVVIKQPKPPLVNPEEALSNPLTRQIYSRGYLLSVQNFHLKPGGVYQFIVGMSIADVEKDMETMRGFIAILLFFSAVLVLIAQMALSFWVVAPIKEFEDEVKAIETGERETIDKPYPDELTPIKNALNSLLGYEKGQKQRYKDSLDDLAHSIKTPLAAMQNQLDQLQREAVGNMQFAPGLKVLEIQIERMREIIAHQLRRAMVTNHSAMIMAQPIRPVLFRLRDTLQKVYRDKDFEFRIAVDEYAKCRMDSEDLMELFGNLLNNACRFCKEIVEVSAHHENNMLVIDIDDDGMGFPSDDPSKLLQRGIREDSKNEGQGIGLAVSTEIVSAINGKIELLVSPYVGARVRLHLPV
ncbi:ATP-binding protein [Candidatus Thiothrix anitrata]|uniref:histidine kinase n=1 Tax=Candidatus Thiothrix anitrata TaxID=2823902 RepID=A0ABX7X1M6_9GAMM|nr:ATP-binding protein [Candidatus Thiothrix anitrata]QTR49804.1 GHKL domain-containing protein [Candidatus Thiothrix anitrata]